MEQLKDCYGKMVNANDEARKLWDVANQAYSCCAKGKPVPLSSFPGAVTGEPASTYGVLHCLTGYRAKKNGVGRGCLDAANFLWETWEFINPRYWEWLPRNKGPRGWLKDTISDMESVVNGYTSAQSPADCIPSQCHRK